METTQAVAPIQQTVTMQLTEQQVAWAGLPVQKNALADSLLKQELTAQGLLQQADAAGEDWNVIDTNLAAYRKLHTEMVEARKPFTGMIQERIIAPLMEFEKRVDPKSNAKYNELFGRSVDIRRKENLKAQQANAKEQEKANFKLHFQNEYVRIVGLYQATVRNEANNIYASYLRGKVQDPAIIDLKKELAKIPTPVINRFNAQYLQKEEMEALFPEVAQPDWQGIFDNLMTEVDTLFSNYSSDLANAEAAIKAQKDATKLAEQAANKKLQEETAMNTLIVQAETPIIEGPKIKKNLQVKTVESEQWAKAVMAAFIVNLPALGGYLRVKSWGNLKISQMADYLGKLATDSGLVFNGLELEEVCK